MPSLGSCGIRREVAALGILRTGADLAHQPACEMAAIVGYILGESWTEPEIAALSVTSDGFVLTDAEFFGEAADLDRNLLNLLVAAEATSVERTEFERRYRERVDDWRPVLSGPQPATDRLTRMDFGADPIRA